MQQEYLGIKDSFMKRKGRTEQKLWTERAPV